MSKTDLFKNMQTVKNSLLSHKMCTLHSKMQWRYEPITY